MTSKAADQLKRLETRFNSLSKSVQGLAEVELASIKLGLAKVELSNMEAKADVQNILDIIKDVSGQSGHRVRKGFNEAVMKVKKRFIQDVKKWKTRKRILFL